jgi:hypothetical protein
MSLPLSRRRFFQGLFGGLLAFLGFHRTARAGLSPGCPPGPGPTAGAFPGPPECVTFTYSPGSWMAPNIDPGGPSLATTFVYDPKAPAGFHPGDPAP